jgi:hypothetical protein
MFVKACYFYYVLSAKFINKIINRLLTKLVDEKKN